MRLGGNGVECGTRLVARLEIEGIGDVKESPFEIVTGERGHRR